MTFDINAESLKREADARAHEVGRLMDAAIERPLAQLRNRFNLTDIIASLLQRSSVRSMLQDWIRRLKA